MNKILDDESDKKVGRRNFLKKLLTYVGGIGAGTFSSLYLTDRAHETLPFHPLKANIGYEKIWKSDDGTKITYKIEEKGSILPFTNSAYEILTIEDESETSRMEDYNHDGKVDSFKLKGTNEDITIKRDLFGNIQYSGGGLTEKEARRVLKTLDNTFKEARETIELEEIGKDIQDFLRIPIRKINSIDSPNFNHLIFLSRE